LTAKKLEVRKETYRDSITMLRISSDLAKLEGIIQAAVVMATQLNKKILKDIGFSGPEIETARADDMIVAIEASEDLYVNQAFSKLDDLLSSKGAYSSQEKSLPKTLNAALSILPEANMVVISVPGEFATREASNALNNGLNVFLFSSNVAIEDEYELKKIATSRGLLMMGPDCGTSIINKTVLGFGNVLTSGPVGIVSASGTGVQQVSTLLDSAGIGISQAIGTGGNDLNDRVGGLTMMQAVKLLDQDPQTKLIILISKPPSPFTAAKVLEEVDKCSKPVIVNFLGSKQELKATKTFAAATLEEAADMACQRLGVKSPAELNNFGEMLQQSVTNSEFRKLSDSQKYVRGLYSGGTLCYEAQVVMMPVLGEIHSNLPLIKSMFVESDAQDLAGNLCIDMGAEEFVVGRAHPMMDFTLRKLRILREARDASVAVILLDVLLGYGSNPDPASELASALREAKNYAASADRYLSVVASVIGTRGDFQGIDAQKRILMNAGVILEQSNAAAARRAALIAIRGNVGGQNPDE
jgi:FdrA protein